MNYAVPYQAAYPQQFAAAPQAAAAPVQGFHTGQLPGYPAHFAGSPAPSGSQAYAPPAAPVFPVANPSHTAPQSDPAQQQSPQPAYARHLVAVARTLEQVIPSYQLLISTLQNLPKEQQTSAQTLEDSLKEAAFHHFASLGAIRRLLMGEAAPDLMLGLSLALNRLVRIHSGARPLMDQLIGSVPPTAQRTLAAHYQAAEAQLSQAAAAVQAVIPPQVWEAARQQVGRAV